MVEGSYWRENTGRRILLGHKKCKNHDGKAVWSGAVHYSFFQSKAVILHYNTENTQWSFQNTEQ